MPKSPARKKMTKTKKAIRRAGREVKKNPPARLARKEREEGKKAALPMRRAITLSKARAKGARIPKKK